jgi:glycine/D-amino acid oxidase-like deaminating enzyme
MELADLNKEERVALVGLTKLVVMSDGEVADEELEHIEELVAAFGEAAYQAALDTFEGEFADEPSFRKFLEQRIVRQEARDLIFGTILESAEEGPLDDRETGLLDWLSRVWNVKIEIADGEEA